MLNACVWRRFVKGHLLSPLAGLSASAAPRLGWYSCSAGMGVPAAAAAMLSSTHLQQIDCGISWLPVLGSGAAVDV